MGFMINKWSSFSSSSSPLSSRLFAWHIVCSNSRFQLHTPKALAKRRFLTDARASKTKNRETITHKRFRRFFFFGWKKTNRAEKKKEVKKKIDKDLRDQRNQRGPKWQARKPERTKMTWRERKCGIAVRVRHPGNERVFRLIGEYIFPDLFHFVKLASSSLHISQARTLIVCTIGFCPRRCICLYTGTGRLKVTCQSEVGENPAKGKKHREARRIYHHRKYYRQLCHHCRPDITAMVDWA